MASVQKSGHSKKRPSKYISKTCKKKKRYLELGVGLQGFLLSCDGGKERVCCREAVQLVERYYENLGQVKSHMTKETNEKATEDKLDFAIKDSNEFAPCIDLPCEGDDSSSASPSVSEENGESLGSEDKELSSKSDSKSKAEGMSPEVNETNSVSRNTNIEALLEEEMAELRNRKQARFSSLETGCAGLVFVRMLKDGSKNKGPNEIVEAIMYDCIHRPKALTRYCLRFLPIQLTCYASAEEVRKVAGPIISHYFPVCKNDEAFKFAILYEARANTSLDRMEIINAVAKLVPEPHSVDLKNPDRTILVQIMKTICAIGVVTNYKGYAKYNIRQLASSHQENHSNDQ